VRRRSVLLAALLLALAAATPGSARADLTIAPGSFELAPLDTAGQPELRAGAHPDHLVTRFAFTTNADGSVDRNVREVAIDLPPGLIGDPTAAPTCPRSRFLQNACDAETQVGTLQVTFVGLSPLQFPLYSITPRDDEFAELGAFAFVLPVRLILRLRDESDYGAEIQLRDLPQNLPLTAAEVELWGVPADHSGAAIPRKALLTNPTACGKQPPAVLRARSWQQPDRWVQTSAPLAGPLAGCDELAFAPTLSATLDAPAADTPSGLSIDVAIPQDDDPDSRVTSQASSLTATLPGGLTLSPGLANGLGACDDADFGLGSGQPPHCPDASKLGTVELTTPTLPAPFVGSIYFGRPTPSERFRLFVTAAGRGLTVKLAGVLRPDPADGQLSIALANLPALPFSHLRLHFKDGPRAPLATPPSCGPGALVVSVTARRGGAPVRRAAILEVTSGPGGTACAQTVPFAPSFVAGSASASAGASAPFFLTVARADGQQLLNRLTATLPAGVTARLANAPRCPAASAATGACPADTRVGSVAIEAGAGTQPLPLTGDVYLTGPHAGAPFGLALVLDGHAGPLDLGRVVVPAALQLGATDARVTVATDPFPELLGGIPLRLRTLALDIDRPSFLRNGTWCQPSRTTAVITSLDAARATAAARYALGGCDRLRFAPRVAVRLGPRRALRRGGRPSVTVVLRVHGAQATMRTATVTLPRALALDPPLTTTVCTQLRARDGTCPQGSAVGSARVRTQLLPRPLTGTVNVVQPRSGGQPELWTTVRALGVRLTLRALTSAPSDGPVSTRFVDLPDVPLSALQLTFAGGADGVLRIAGGDLCAPGAPPRVLAHATLRGHNGARRALRVSAVPTC
jgi:hypothetical protein